MTRTLLGSVLAVASAAGCSDADSGAPLESGEEVGSLDLLLSAVPADAKCLKVSVTGNRSVSKSFDLAPGSAPALSIDRLPVGVAKIDARGFANGCSSVTASSVPSWVLEEPVTARIDALEVARILLKLVRNGRGEIRVDFEAPPWMSTSRAPVDLAIIGDTPYGAAQIEDFPNLLAAIDADARISSVVHLGDIKNGASRCDDAYFAQIFAGISTLSIPLVYTPGDNEWTDCHRANNGAYDPIERLAALRRVFFPVPGLALGGGFKQVFAQSEVDGFETFVENQIWFEAGVAFGAVHVVGSNDSTPPWYADDATGTKADDPARRDAERNARQAAALAWLDQLFAIASEQSAAGVAILMQADMFDAFSVANGIPLDAFNPIVLRVATLSRAFAKPVLLLQGDSHVFIVDKPLQAGSGVHGVSVAAPNVTRIVVQGSTTTPLTEWLRVRVDPSSPAVFTWERNAR